MNSVAMRGPDKGRGLEQRARVRRFEPEVGERGRGGAAAARRALDETLLEQVGLVDVLDGVLLLPHRDGKGRQADGSAGELLADGAEQLAVERVEAGLVDAQHLQ